MTNEEIKIKCLEFALAIGPYYDGCGPLKTVQEIANELYSWVTDSPKLKIGKDYCDNRTTEAIGNLKTKDIL